MARETMKNDAEISSLSLAYTLQGKLLNMVEVTFLFEQHVFLSWMCDFKKQGEINCNVI